MPEDTYVPFAEMLGFEALLESQGADLESLTSIYKGTAHSGASLSENLLRYRFETFHRCMNEARESLQQFRRGTFVLFSAWASIQSFPR